MTFLLLLRLTVKRFFFPLPFVRFFLLFSSRLFDWGAGEGIFSTLIMHEDWSPEIKNVLIPHIYHKRYRTKIYPSSDEKPSNAKKSVIVVLSPRHRPYFVFFFSALVSLNEATIHVKQSFRTLSLMQENIVQV